MRYFTRLGGFLVALLLCIAFSSAPVSVALAQDQPAAETPMAAPEEAAPAEEAAAAEEVVEEEAPTIDSGNTAWMLTSSALVLMMTIPGLALFYGGMVRKKNVLATAMQSFTVACLVTVLWMIAGYSLAFTDGGSLQMYVGGLSKFMLKGMTPESISGSIPESVFMVFQMTFAIITPALIAGAFAERMKFTSLLWFMGLWVLVVYCPVAHWVWGGGFLAGMGTLDFAGGTVVHLNAGIAGLVCALVMGPRKGYRTKGGQQSEALIPHNVLLSLIGASLLWVGWFGFNAGSELAADGIAGAAFANTQIATAMAGLAWMFSEWLFRGKPSVFGIISGAVAGLVAITPASGFVELDAALYIGIAAGVVCFLATAFLKNLLGYDDSLDAFGVHGVGGFLGAVLTGIFASPAINSLGTGLLFDNPGQLMTQLQACGLVAAYDAIATFVILIVLRITVGLRVDESAEVEGLDLALHGEQIQ